MNRWLATAYLIAITYTAVIIWYNWPVEMPVVEDPEYPSLILYDNCGNGSYYIMNADGTQRCRYPGMESWWTMIEWAEPTPCWLTIEQVLSFPLVKPRERRPGIPFSPSARIVSGIHP